MTVTASQMIKPTGTPITPASNSSTNNNCRKDGGGIPPTGISTSVVPQEHFRGLDVPLYLLDIFSLIVREHRRSLARFPLAQVLLEQLQRQPQLGPSDVGRALWTDFQLHQ